MICSKKLKILFVILILSVLLSVIVSNNHIQVKTYNENDLSEGRIVLLSDLHGKSFGNGNDRIVRKIIDLSPSIICLNGDFIDEDNTEADNAEFLELLNKLTEIAPVYYSYGNHDLGYFNEHGFALTEAIIETGCIILEEEFVDIEINGKQLRLGGMFDYAFNQQYIPYYEWIQDSTYKFLSDFTDTDRTKILMCHRPESFIYDDASLWNIDLVLCGHTHGGIWRFPFIGGVIAPEQGILPEFDKGEFEIGNIKMIISSGFAGYRNIPRLFNCPEITVIEL